MEWLTLPEDHPERTTCAACKRERGSDEPCEGCTEPAVYEENLEAVTLFLAAQTQWRVMPMGGYLGYDYPAVEWVARLVLGRPIDADLFSQIRIMEAAFLDVAARRSRT